MVDQTLAFYANIQNPNLKPNYVGDGILSMGISGYALLQFVRLYVALPGDKNVVEALTNIVEGGFSTNKGIPMISSLSNENLMKIFSFEPDNDGELPFLFGKMFYFNILNRVFTKMVNSLGGKQSQHGQRLERKRAVAFRKLQDEELVDIITIRDRFISEFLRKNRRTRQIVIQSK